MASQIKAEKSIYDVKLLSRKSIIQTASYHYIPIVSVLVFLGIVIFPVIGTINEINNKRAIIEQKNIQIQNRDTEISQLQELDASTSVRRTDLAKIDSIIPSGKSEVVAFVSEIESIAKNQNLEKNEQKSSESIQSTDEEGVNIVNEQNELVGFISIENSFSFSGTEKDIKDYLELLYNKSDLIIVKSMVFEGPEARLLRQQEAEDAGSVIEFDPNLGESWTIEVRFAKYQFSDSFQSSLSTQEVGLTESPDEETIKLINNRY